ncbi:uncharacterized protein LOC144427138 [Styela clava]
MLKVVFQTLFNFIMCIVGGQTYTDSESQKVDRAEEDLKNSITMKQKSSVEINQNEEETLLEEDSEEDCSVVDWRAVDEVASEEIIQNEETQLKTNIEYPSMSNRLFVRFLLERNEIIDKYRNIAMHENDWKNFAINHLNIPEKLIRKLKSKFGGTQTKMKLKMLLLWRNKHKQQELAKEELIQCAEDFIDKELNIDVANHSFTDVCRLIVTAIPNEKWMRFARLELALAEKEISNLRAKYSEFTEEQKYQMLRWFLRGNEGFSGDTGEDIIGRDYQIIPISSI